MTSTSFAKTHFHSVLMLGKPPLSVTTLGQLGSQHFFGSLGIRSRLSCSNVRNVVCFVPIFFLVSVIAVVVFIISGGFNGLALLL